MTFGQKTCLKTQKTCRTTCRTTYLKTQTNCRNTWKTYLKTQTTCRKTCRETRRRTYRAKTQRATATREKTSTASRAVLAILAGV